MRNIESFKSYTSLAIAVISLVLSLHIEYTYSKRYVEQQQIDAVMELVDSIAHKPINYVLCAKTRSGYITKYENRNLFEFSDTVKYQGTNYPIVFRNKDWYFSFNRFRYNPLIPTPIANVLKEYDGEYESCNFDIDKHQIYIGMGDDLYALRTDFISAKERFGYNQYVYYRKDAPAFKNVQSLIMTNLKLRKTIAKWLKSKRLDDINLGE